MKELIAIQNELKAPKGNFNSFGKYHYRSCEDILEAVKPLLKKYECQLIIGDEIIEVGGKLFVKAIATISNKDEVVRTQAFAQLDEHKGMSLDQCTGTASSYARKYCLNGLFLIDDTKDSDSNEAHVERKQKSSSAPKLKPLPHTAKELKEIAEQNYIDLAPWLEKAGVKTVEELTQEQIDKTVAWIESRKRGKK